MNSFVNINALNRLSQQQKMILYIILVIAILYVVYSVFFSEKMDNMKASYAALTIPGQNSLNEHIVTGEVYRYLHHNGYVSYDIYGYFPILNGGIFEKRIDSKYEVTFMDKDGKVLFSQELQKDGDGVYKLKIHNKKFMDTDAEQYNFVRVKITSDDKSSIVVDGILKDL